MKNISLLLILLLKVLGASEALGQMTVYSQGSGDWDAVDLWNTAADGSGTPMTAPDDVTTSVVIQNGHTINLVASPVYKVANLTIDAGGALRANASGNRFLSVYGTSIIVNGTAGGAGDGLGFNVLGPNCTLTGTGSMLLSRIRKELLTMASNTTDLTIENCTVNLSWVFTSTSSALYNTGSAGSTAQRTFNVTIASTATVNVVGDVGIDGPDGTTIAWNDGTYTIDGTLNVGGDLIVRTANPTGGDINYIINGTVIVGGNVIGNNGNGGLAVAHLTINSGGVLRVTGANAIFTTIDDTNLRNSFTFEDNSEVAYSSAAAQNIYSFAYANLSSSGGGAKTLDDDTTVKGDLNLADGNIVLGDNDLTLAPTGTVITSSPASYLQTDGTGVFKRTVDDTPSSFPVGRSSYNLAILTRSSGAAVYNVRLALEEVRLEGFAGDVVDNRVVGRTWDITADGDVGTLTVELLWNGGEELTGFLLTSCSVARYDGAEWQAGTSQVANGTNPYLASKTGVTELSPFVVQSENALPVTLLDFSAIREGRTARLDWRTASEYRNDYFALERSAKGTDFEEIGRVAGAGSSTTPSHYRYVDAQPLPGLNYYRLRQVDHDGTATYHKVVAVDMGGQDLGGLHLFPSPVQGLLSVQVAEAPEQDSELLLLNPHGQVLYRTILPQGNDRLGIDVAHLPAGHYYLQLLSSGRQAIARWVKQ